MGNKKYDGSWSQPRRIGRREVKGISVGFRMDVLLRGRLNSREKNVFPRRQTGYSVEYLAPAINQPGAMAVLHG